MGLGIAERVKKVFQKKEAAKAQAPSKKSAQEEILGSLTFEQATAALAPDGPLDRQRRPPAQGAAKKQPTQPQAVATATAALQWKVASDGSAKKSAPRAPVLGAHKGGALPNAAIAKTAPAPYASLADLRGGGAAAQKQPSLYAESPALSTITPDTGLYQDGITLDAPRPEAPAPASSAFYEAPAVAPAEAPSAFYEAPEVAPAQVPPRAPTQADPTALYQNLDDAPAEGSPEVVASTRASAAQVASDAELDRIAELAVQMPPPEEQGSPELALLRQAGKHDADSLDRMDMTAREQGAKGWALLPMMSSQRVCDTQMFKTNYRYDDDADLAANKGGATQTTDRGEAIVELKDGRFVFMQSGRELDSSSLELPGFLVHNAIKDRKAALGRDMTVAERQQLGQELTAAGGRYIFVMDASGTIYAGESIHGVQHHSSFMGGGAVAAAGEIVVSGGKLTLISNQSGHYQPGPGFLWQAIAQMAGQGVDMSSVTAELLGVGRMNAAEFLHFFNPLADPELMRADYATAALKRYLADPRNAQAAHGKQEIPDAPVTGPEGKKEMAHA